MRYAKPLATFNRHFSSTVPFQSQPTVPPHPAIARFVRDTLALSAGVHLVEACLRLRLAAIDVQIEYLTDAAARVHEISEAFTHADLSKAELAELVAEFKALEAATIYRDAAPSERAQMLADLQAFPDRALISALRLIYAEVMGGAA